MVGKDIQKVTKFAVGTPRCFPIKLADNIDIESLRHVKHPDYSGIFVQTDATVEGNVRLVEKDAELSSVVVIGIGLTNLVGVWDIVEIINPSTIVYFRLNPCC